MRAIRFSKTGFHHFGAVPVAAVICVLVSKIVLAVAEFAVQLRLQTDFENISYKFFKQGV